MIKNRYLYRKNNGKILSEDTVLPATIDDLITLLDKTFPLSKPELSASISDVQRKAGQRDVVDWLIDLQKQRDANVLSSK